MAESTSQEKRDRSIRLLEAELDFLEGGGYGAPAGHPDQQKPIFYHSPACINHWLVPDHNTECHDDCVLLDAVPQAHRNEALPCHFIPLNESGETVRSLERKGGQERAEAVVRQWLKATIERLRAGEDVLGVSDVGY